MRGAVCLTLVVLCGGVLSCARNPAPRVVATRPADPRLQLVPLPKQLDARGGEFQLTPALTIYADSDVFLSSAQFLANFIRLGLGDQPPKVVVGSEPPPGSVRIRRYAGSEPLSDEGYVLSITPAGVTIDAIAAAGAFYGIQTLRQLLPPAFEHEALRPPRRNAPLPALGAIEIRDEPRFAWRGAMLDVARHFLEVSEVKRFIDLMALHKLNRLHLHLSDDQGWRIEIKSWPDLTARGGRTEVGGGTGGFYTQSQYVELVQYAADRFITIVPEIDMPGHTNAALASYAELNCDGVARPVYTGTEVGFSSLCADKDVTYKFVDDVVREIAALTPGRYFHIGGDEVKTLSPVQYRTFIERVQTIVTSHGKHMVGWDEIAPTQLLPTSIVQHWRPKTSPTEAVAKGAKVIMSIAEKAYLDMKYEATTPIGLTWAGTVSLRTSYDWDPATVAAGVPETALLGVEAPLWSETLANIRDVELMAFPRLAAIAEIAWSPQSIRDWDGFRVRVGAQAPRWTALGLNFYRSPEISWR